MNRTTLRVVFARNPPDIYEDCLKFPTLYPSFRCSYPGRTAEILGILTEYLNWDIEPIIMDSSNGTNFGSFDRELGEWTGALGYLYPNEADTKSLTYEYTQNNEVYFDYSYPIWNTTVVYVTKSKTRTLLSAMWNSYSPFSIEVWLVILLSLLVQAGNATLIRYVDGKFFKSTQLFNLGKDCGTQARRLSFVAKRIYQATKVTIMYKKYSSERSEEIRDLRNSV